MCGKEAVQKLQPKTLRRGSWKEQRLGAKLRVSKGHRMGKLGSGQFSSYPQRSEGLWLAYGLP